MGTPPLSFQWRCNGTNVLDATNADLCLANVCLTQAGSYQCLVSNACGSLITPPSALAVLRSTPVFDPTPGGVQRTPDGIVLRLTGLSGHGEIILESSPDLRSWTPVATNPPALGAAHLLDPTATDASLRFYRALEK